MDDFATWIAFSLLILGIALITGLLGAAITMAVLTYLWPEKSEVEQCGDTELHLLSKMTDPLWDDVRTRFRIPGNRVEKLLTQKIYLERLLLRSAPHEHGNIKAEIRDLEDEIKVALRICQSLYAQVDENLQQGAGPREIEPLLPHLIDALPGGSNGSSGSGSGGGIEAPPISMPPPTPSGLRSASPSAPRSIAPAN